MAVKGLFFLWTHEKAQADSTLSCKPASLIMSIWSDHQVVLCWLVECRMVWVIAAFNCMQVASSDCCRYLLSSVNMRYYLYLKVLFSIHQSFSLLLYFSMWNKNGSHSFFLKHRILIVMLWVWLAEAAPVTGSLEMLNCTFLSSECSAGLRWSHSASRLSSLGYSPLQFVKGNKENSVLLISFLSIILSVRNVFTGIGLARDKWHQHGR